jgi:hypothetical protein
MIAFSLVLKRFGLYWCYPVTNFDKITIAADASFMYAENITFPYLVSVLASP